MGEIFALGCALVWAFAVILLQRSTERVSPLALNLFRASVSAPLLILTLLLSGGSLLPSAPLRDYAILLASGVIGIAFADTLFHRSLSILGSGISAIVATTYSPMVVVMAFLLIGERPRPVDLAGMVLIMGSVAISGSLTAPAGHPRRKLLIGIGLGVLDMLLLSFSIILAKPVLDRSSVLWTAVVREVAALVVLLLMAALARHRRECLAVYRPQASWRFTLPGAALGSYVALILWIAGMKYTLASVAAILTQTTTVFILILAVLLLREPFNLRKGLAATLAMGGVLLITMT